MCERFVRSIKSGFILLKAGGGGGVRAAANVPVPLRENCAAHGGCKSDYPRTPKNKTRRPKIDRCQHIVHRVEGVHCTSSDSDCDCSCTCYCRSWSSSNQRLNSSLRENSSSQPLFSGRRRASHQGGSFSNIRCICLLPSGSRLSRTPAVTACKTW